MGDLCTYACHVLAYIKPQHKFQGTYFLETPDAAPLVSTIKQALKNRESLDSYLSSDVALAFKSLAQEINLVGKDLYSAGRESMKELFTAFAKNMSPPNEYFTHAVWEQLLRAWPGRLPEQLEQQGKTLQEIRENKPWLLEGGIFDLMEACEEETGRQASYQALISPKGWPPKN